MKKGWTLIETDAALVAQLQKALGVSPVLCRLLVQRGVTSFSAAHRFFRPSLQHLHDPFRMRDMALAVERLHRALNKRERILLYGDYDVDGITAVAFLYRFLAARGARLDYYLPDRYREGYGLSTDGVDYAVQTGTQLLIALDCGIRAVEPARRARRAGVDLIICDHHLPGADLPVATAVLDPKRRDATYPFSGLSGCGIALKLAQAYASRYGLPEHSWSDLLDLVTVSIAADIVPIVDENRILAWFGLQRLARRPLAGFSALIEGSRRRRPLNISDIVFGLTPLLNAAGRMADAQQAVKLLLTDEPKVAADYTRVLLYRNELRREYDKRVTEEAAAQCAHILQAGERRSLVCYAAHWHQGVVGIAASRLVDRFFRPAVVLTRADRLLVGSARSIPGFNLHAALSLCSDLLVSYGGHEQAAGMKLAPENLTAFQDRFEGATQTILGAAAPKPEIRIAADLPLSGIRPDFWKILKQFAPFGPGNRSPVFRARGVRDTGYSRRLRGNHLRLSIRQDDSPVFTGIAFDQGDAYPGIADRRPFDICYTLQEDRFGAVPILQLVVKDIKFP